MSECHWFVVDLRGLDNYVFGYYGFESNLMKIITGRLLSHSVVVVSSSSRYVVVTDNGNNGQ